MIIDGHEDIAYNVLTWGRDFTASVAKTRAREVGQSSDAGICTVGLPELRQGGVRLVFGTLFALPAHASGARLATAGGYRIPAEAHQQARAQLAVYRDLARRDDVRLIERQGELAALANGQPDPALGIVLLMEGADPIRTPDEVPWWAAQGVRIVGPAWQATRYCGGTDHPGPLTAEGHLLLDELARAGMILDISHMAEESFWQALDRFDGAMIASHSNCRVHASPACADRHLSDAMIQTLIEREAVIGVVLYNKFLVREWQPAHTRDMVGLEAAVRHIDHICQIAGNAQHVAIGSDFDGGFGREAIPHELDSIADLALLAAALRASGYAQDDIDAIMGRNWLRVLQQHLPT